MHPQLEQLSVFTWINILESNDKCISLLEDLFIELIPRKTDLAPPCPKCSSSMKVQARKNCPLRWRWVCRRSKCRGTTLSPLIGTFFEGVSLPFLDILGMMFAYILKISVADIREHLECWRGNRNQDFGRHKKQIGTVTIMDFYSRFDKVILKSLKETSVVHIKRSNREKLLQKYKKTLKTEPFFRNIVYQLLMDIKSKFPCFKKKVIHETENLVVPVSSTSANNLIYESLSPNVDSQSNNQFSSETKLNFPTSSSTTSSPVVSVKNNNVELTTTPNAASVSTNTQTANTVTSTHFQLNNKTSNGTNLNLSTSTLLPILNSSVFSAKNTNLVRTVTSNIIPDSTSTPTANTITCVRTSRLSDFVSISVIENVPFIRNPNIGAGNLITLNNTPSAPSIKKENIKEENMTLSNALSSDDIAYSSNTALLKENLNYLSCDCVIFDDFCIDDDQIMDTGDV